MWETIGTYSCHGLGGTQAFVYTKDNRILKSSSLCVTANVTSNLVHLIYCRAHTASNIHWKYDKEVNKFKLFLIIYNLKFISF